MIRRRHVYHLAGYDPIDAEGQYRRFRRQLEVFRRTWNVNASIDAIERSSSPPTARWAVNAKAANWNIDAVHEVWMWDDLVRGDFTRALPVRLYKAVITYLDFILTGTMFRYVMANQRYAIFFLFPILAVVLFATAGWFVGRWVTAALGLGGIGATAVGILCGLVVFLALLRWPGRRWRVELLLDDWIYARDYLYGRRPDIDARLDQFADALLARVRAGGVDEVVVVGHSLGAMFAVDVIVRALTREPRFARCGVSVCLLTIGATIPKFALHPRAQRIRAMTARAAAEPLVAWAEYQSRGDAISFYRFDPVALKRIPGDRLDGRPVIRRVHIHDMITPESFARCRFNVLLLHYRSVMANDRRAAYDYYMMTCGPIAFADWTTAQSGFLDFIAADGSLANKAPARAAASAS